MTEIQVETIVEELTREQSRLRDRLTTLKAELAEIEAALARVTGALSALRGSSKKKTQRRPAASKQDVIALMANVLAEREVLSREVLKQIVEQRLLASGKSRMGFALRFKEALAEAQFLETEEGICLNEGLLPEMLSG